MVSVKLERALYFVSNLCEKIYYLGVVKRPFSIFPQYILLRWSLWPDFCPVIVYVFFRATEYGWSVVGFTIFYFITSNSVCKGCCRPFRTNYGGIQVDWLYRSIYFLLSYVLFKIYVRYI